MFATQLLRHQHVSTLSPNLIVKNRKRTDWEEVGAKRDHSVIPDSYKQRLHDLI